MWSNRERNREEDERYVSRTTNRLRGVASTARVGGDADPEKIRARLSRMKHGASRDPQPSESPA